MLIKNVIFDFDGTLVDSSFTVEKLYNHFKLKYQSMDIDSEQFRKLKAFPLKEKIQKIGLPLYKLLSMSMEAKKLYASYIKEINMFPDVPLLLQKLTAKGIMLDILSSNSIRNIKSFLHANSIDYFGDVYAAPHMLQKDRAIDKLLSSKSLSRENILYVGDEAHDIQACKKIQVKVAAVTWGFDSAETLTREKPDYICRKPLDLFSFLYEDTV